MYLSDREMADAITLEIANLGPFHIVLEESDVIAQITVAQITSVPPETMEQFGSTTRGQADVGGKPQPRQSSRAGRKPGKTGR